MLICSRLKTINFPASVVSLDSGDREFIFRRHDVGHEMFIVADGIVHLIDHVADISDAKVLKFGACIDEHMALLPTAGYLRRYSAYAESGN